MPDPKDDEGYVKEREYAQYRKISESMSAKRKPKDQAAADNEYDPHKW